jgi:hypothetical protein
MTIFEVVQWRDKANALWRLRPGQEDLCCGPLQTLDQRSGPLNMG